MKKLSLLLLPVAFGAFQSGIMARTDAVTPIFDVSTRYLLGGSQNGKWLDAKTTAQSMKSASNLRVFSATRALGNGRATPPKSEGAPCDETLFSDITPDFAKANAQFAIGGAYNPLPRAVRVESTNQANYRGIVAAILRGHGIAKPTVQITQIWRVDLDGDGAAEVLISAARKEDGGDPMRISPDARAGDYSLLLMRKIVAGQPKNILLDSEFHPVAKGFSAPGFSRFAAVFDADGDGKMEILTRGGYYEGVWTQLYSVSGNAKPRAVLSEGCGA